MMGYRVISALDVFMFRLSLGKVGRTEANLLIKREVSVVSYYGTISEGFRNIVNQKKFYGCEQESQDLI
jgi:hypothetical protein